MRITSVEVFHFNLENGWQPIICKVNTDEGICGYGEAGLAYGVGGSGAYGIIKDLAQIIIGVDPMCIEAIWEKMLKTTFWGQGGGTIIFAGMSAIDIALWDIKGKELGVPAYQLLGGKSRNELRCYASQTQFGWGSKWENLAEPAEYAEAALKAVEDGYDCIKVDVLGYDTKGEWAGWDLSKHLSVEQMKFGYNRLKAIRDAVGPDIDIIVEMHCFTDTNTAIQFGKAIQELEIFYYEEPVMPLNPKMTKEIKDNLTIPIASGERIFSRWGYLPFFELRAVDVIQPDFTTCGGISEGKKICDMAHTYDISVQGHVCGSPISKAAALQVEAVIPNFLIHEHHRGALMEHNIDLCKFNYQPVNGRYHIPDLPGIGQELTEDAMENAAEKITIK